MYRYFLVFFLFAFVNTAFSQVNDTVQFIPPQYNIQMDEFPLMKLNVRVSDGGNQVTITTKDAYILEEAMVCEPIEVGPVVDGWQTVKWYTKLTDFTKIGQDNKDYFGNLLVIYKNQPYRTLISGNIQQAPYLIVVSSITNLQIREAYWPIVTPGNSVPYPLMIRGFMRDTRTGQQTNLKIDSIKTRTPYFKHKWLGPLIGEKREPPAEIGVDIDYLINVYFEPDKFGYFQDVMTIYFNNGMTRHIPLYGNSFKVELEKLIELVEPKPGMALAPCQSVTLKWKGHDPAYPVDLYYSIDAGFNWRKIDYTQDSTYQWIVPNVETQFLHLKVRQDFQNSKTELLREDFFPVFSVNYNYSGTQLASVNSMGKVLSWDLTSAGTPTIIKRQHIELNDEESEERFYSFGLEYSADDNKIFVGYRNLLLPPAIRRDTIAVFEGINEFPVQKIALPQGFITNKIYADRQKQTLTAFPHYGNRILQYSMLTGAQIKDMSFDSPIMDIAFNTRTETAAILFINGRIKLYNLPDFTVIDELNFDIFPNFLKIAFSPNGKMLSIGSQADGSGLRTNSYLIDIATRQIVKVFTPSSGNPVAMQFNPTSTSVVVGSETDRQIAIYDLTSTETTSNLFGHTENMTDMKLSPNGLSIVSTSLSKNDNIVYRTFTYPQEDQTDGYLIIEQPKLNQEIVKIPNAYLGTDNLHSITSVCNLGLSMADIYDARFRNGTHYKLVETWNRDTALANQCFNFDIVFSPLDTGIIRDTLIMYHCTKQYLIPFESYSYSRRITLLSNNVDFGEVCLGDTLVKEIELFRNDDPAPLKLNYTQLLSKEGLAFGLILGKRDSVLQPGEVYLLKVRFVPNAIGLQTGDIQIYHSNQNKYITISKVQGTGIGSYLELSHETLRFIPEQTTREITMKNTGVTDVFFEQFRVSPAGAFEVLTPAGFNLKPGEVKTIQVRWNGVDETPAQLITDANPCLVQKYIPLNFYRGGSQITIPTVTAEAYSENVRIPIVYTNTENGEYKGIRDFEASFDLDYRLFLPRRIETKYNSAEITSNRVNSNVRTFGIKVSGDFALKDTIATIIGVAGLSEIDRTPITYNENSPGWSKFISTVTIPGELIISGICEDRYVIKLNSKIKEVMVIPNPVSMMAKISYELSEDSYVDFDLVDNNGVVHNLIKKLSAFKGNNTTDIDISSFGTGNYKLRITAGSEFLTRNIIILR